MKRSFKHIVILALASALAAFVSTGCGTIRGFGRDVGTVGAGIQNAAR